MAGISTFNHAARIVALVTPRLPADAALRHQLAASPGMGTREKGAISRAVFAYFRWVRWCEPKDSLQKQLADAWALHERFTADPKAIKPEALAARAVPAWLRDELEVTPEFLRQIQREPALWLRTRPGTAIKLADTLSNCLPSGAGLRPALPDALRYSGPLDLFRTPEFHAGVFEIQDLASQLVGLACAPKPGD